MEVLENRKVEVKNGASAAKALDFRVVGRVVGATS